MKKYGIFFFYLVALAAAGYFLREYLHTPREFIISLIISLVIIARIARQKKSYLPLVGSILLIGHMLRMIWIFIPVYNHQPDIRQWYRKTPNMIRSLPETNSGVLLFLEHAWKTTTLQANQLKTWKPIYQGDRIRTAGPSLSFDDRLAIFLRDGSHIQVLPQSSMSFETLSPDYLKLSGSRISVILQQWVISMSTRRKEFLPIQRYVKAWNLSFSCRSCIIAFSGSAWTIASDASFIRRTTSGEKLSISGGVYNFSRNSITRTTNSTIISLLSDTQSSLFSRRNDYDKQRNNFISTERWRPLDTSPMLESVSKIKMSLAWFADRSYLRKRDNLALYEYLRWSSEIFPSAFDEQKNLYEFMQ